MLVPTIERVYSLKRALELDPAKEKGEVVGKNKVLMDKVRFCFCFCFSCFLLWLLLLIYINKK